MTFPFPFQLKCPKCGSDRITSYMSIVVDGGLDCGCNECRHLWLELNLERKERAMSGELLNDSEYKTAVNLLDGAKVNLERLIADDRLRDPRRLTGRLGQIITGLSLLSLHVSGAESITFKSDYGHIRVTKVDPDQEQE